MLDYVEQRNEDQMIWVVSDAGKMETLRCLPLIINLMSNEIECWNCGKMDNRSAFCCTTYKKRLGKWYGLHSYCNGTWCDWCDDGWWLKIIFCQTTMSESYPDGRNIRPSRHNLSMMSSALLRGISRRSPSVKTSIRPTQNPSHDFFLLDGVSDGPFLHIQMNWLVDEIKSIHPWIYMKDGVEFNGQGRLEMLWRPSFGKSSRYRWLGCIFASASEDIFSKRSPCVGIATRHQWTVLVQDVDCAFVTVHGGDTWALQTWECLSLHLMKQRISQRQNRPRRSPRHSTNPHLLRSIKRQ